MVAGRNSLTHGTVRRSDCKILKAGEFQLTIFVPADRRPARRSLVEEECMLRSKPRSTILRPRMYSANGATGQYGKHEN